MEWTLYLCRSSEDKVMVDLHLIVLADKDRAYETTTKSLEWEECSPLDRIF